MKNDRLLFRLQRQYVYVASAKLYRFPTDLKHSGIFSKQNVGMLCHYDSAEDLCNY